MLAIERIRIVDFHREMHVAEGIKIRNVINAFGNLSVTFLEFWACVPTGGCERVRMHMMPSLMLAFSPKLHVLLLFECE